MSTIDSAAAPPAASTTRRLEPLMGELFRYTLVGGLAFVADFGTLALLTELAGLHYLASAATAFIVGLSINYLLSVLWVFRQRRTTSIGREFMIFAIIGVLGLLLTEMLLAIGSGQFGIDYRWIKVVAVGGVFVWNFVARKVLLFSEGEIAS